ncbi:MAG TPA: alpha/beta fold hydrolase [Actinomycetota bacterium]
MGEERFQIETPKGPVTGLWVEVPAARAVICVAHGAGGNLHTRLLDGFCAALNSAAYDTLRFNFPYSEQGRKSPDRPDVLIATWRAAVDEAHARASDRQVFAAGKSMGGRIASMAAAEGMPVSGLVFIGYPLHPPGNPEKIRDAHLADVHVPMLFLQGTDDAFARWDLLEATVKRLGRWAQLHRVEGGDHSFRVKGDRRPDEETGRLLGSVAARFVQGAQI